MKRKLIISVLLWPSPIGNTSKNVLCVQYSSLHGLIVSKPLLPFKVFDGYWVILTTDKVNPSPSTIISIIRQWHDQTVQEASSWARMLNKKTALCALPACATLQWMLSINDPRTLPWLLYYSICFENIFTYHVCKSLKGKLKQRYFGLTDLEEVVCHSIVQMTRAMTDASISSSQVRPPSISWKILSSFFALAACIIRSPASNA